MTAAALRRFDPKWPWNANYPLSQAVRCGDFVYLAGQVALTPDGQVVGRELGSQARQMFENTKTLLGMAGAQPSDIVKLTTYFVSNIDSAEERERYFAVRREYLGDRKPASTGLQIVALSEQHLLVEMDVVAYAPLNPAQRPRVEMFDIGWDWDDAFPFSSAVRCGDFIFTSGQVAYNADGRIVGADLKTQTRQVFENISHILGLAGARLQDVVRMHTFFTRDVRAPQDYFAVRREFFGDHKPASTGVQVAALVADELLLEVEVVAYAPRAI